MRGRVEPPKRRRQFSAKCFVTNVVFVTHVTIIHSNHKIGFEPLRTGARLHGCTVFGDTYFVPQILVTSSEDLFGEIIVLMIIIITRLVANRPPDC